jgi:hypothetical protein
MQQLAPRTTAVSSVAREPLLNPSQLRSFIVDKTTANNAADRRARPRLAPMRTSININDFHLHRRPQAQAGPGCTKLR